MLPPSRGNQLGAEAIQYLHPKRQRRKRGMGFYGGKSTAIVKISRQKGQHTRRKGWWELCCKENVRGSGEEANL